MTENTIWLYGESRIDDPPENRIAFDSKEAADVHARQQAEGHVEEQGEDPPRRVEYEAWFGYATNARSFQVWPIPHHSGKDRDPDASAQEIVETIANHVPGFEANPGDSPPQYLNHDQLVALKDEIQRIKDKQNRDNG